MEDPLSFGPHPAGLKLIETLLWDGAARPALEHGVTTVVPGNCSLSLAPLKAGDRRALVGIYARLAASLRNLGGGEAARHGGGPAGSGRSVTILPKLFDFGSTSMIAMPLLLRNALASS